MMLLSSAEGPSVQSAVQTVLPDPFAPVHLTGLPARRVSFARTAGEPSRKMVKSHSFHQGMLECGDLSTVGALKRRRSSGKAAPPAGGGGLM